MQIMQLNPAGDIERDVLSSTKYMAFIYHLVWLVCFCGEGWWL